jgi:DNA-binding MarR family transcriptional regulator
MANLNEIFDKLTKAMPIIRSSALKQEYEGIRQIISENPEISATELAEKLGCHERRAQRLIDSLKEAKAPEEQATEIAGLTAEEIDTLSELLDKINSSQEEQSRQRSYSSRGYRRSYMPNRQRQENFRSEHRGRSGHKGRH